MVRVVAVGTEGATAFITPLPLVFLPSQACCFFGTTSSAAATTAGACGKLAPGTEAPSVFSRVIQCRLVPPGTILQPCSPGAAAGGGAAVVRARRCWLWWCRTGWAPSVSDAIRGYRSYP